MRKPCRTKKTKAGGKIHLYGNGHWKEISYAKNGKYEEEDEPYFTYQNRRHFLSEFMRLSPESPIYEFGNMRFDGYLNDSFFSGLLIKYHESEELVKVYTFIS